MKEHQIAQLVNDITSAVRYNFPGAAQSLREIIGNVVNSDVNIKSNSKHIDNLNLKIELLINNWPESPENTQALSRLIDTIAKAEEECGD